MGAIVTTSVDEVMIILLHLDEPLVILFWLK